MNLTIPADDAEAWFAHLDAEIEERSWYSSSFSQLEADENSGTLSVHTAHGPDPPSLHIVWDKPRSGPLRVRARPGGSPPLPLDIASQLLRATSDRLRAGETLRGYRRAYLAYEGLPWRGELWLGDAVRLGPPSQHAEWLLAPQIVIVDALIEGIGNKGLSAGFRTLLEELEIFLGFVVGPRFALPASGFAWVCRPGEGGRLTGCELAPLGYLESSSSVGMPPRGKAPAIPTREIERPDHSRWGISNERELWVSDDIHELWAAFNGLAPSMRAQILRAGNAYRIGQSLWPEQLTAYAAFMVVACEALKPVGKKFDDANVYHVVEGLLGANIAQELRTLRIPPQRMRSDLFHRGERQAEEIARWLFADPFVDPTFDETIRALGRVARTCLIEWLRRGGSYAIPRPARRRSPRRKLLGYLGHDGDEWLS